MSLTPTQAARWESDGFLTGIDVCSPAEAARLRAEFDALEAREGRDRCVIGLVDRHYSERFIWEIATHPTILDAVESLIGPDILLMATHFFCKYRDETKFVAWHQDVTYWGLEPPEAITAWYAVDDADVENGCMRVLPGTHRRGVREHGKSSAKGNLLSVNQETFVTAEEEASAADIELRAGQISIHHGSLIHGSLPNRSDRRRCGLTIRFIPPQVRQVNRNSFGRGWDAILVRGGDRFGNFDLKDRPFE